MVGDGGVIHCDRRYPQVTITIQGHQFTTDLFGLPLSGADLVLGVQWLRALGPVTTDYTTLPMSFTHMGLPIQIIADVPVTPPSASAHQLRRMLQSSNAGRRGPVSVRPCLFFFNYQLPHLTS